MTIRISAALKSFRFLPEPEEMVAKRLPSDGLFKVLTRNITGVL